MMLNAFVFAKSDYSVSRYCLQVIKGQRIKGKHIIIPPQKGIME